MLNFTGDPDQDHHLLGRKTILMTMLYIGRVL